MCSYVPGAVDEDMLTLEVPKLPTLKVYEHNEEESLQSGPGLSFDMKETVLRDRNEHFE
jgi:hypothetical protein